LNKLVSVVIPNHNYSQYIEKAIDCALNQTYKAVEIIVVDNGSTDESRKILQAYGNEIITIFQNNQGQACARNSGLLAANGQFIALLDADDYWEKQKIEIQIDLIQTSSEFVYTGFRQFESLTNSTISEVRPFFKGDCALAFIQNPTRSIIPGGESSALFTRELLNQVGLFNPKLSSASGRDFFRRCSRKTNISSVDSLLMNYRAHDLNMSRNSQAMMADTLKAYQALFEDEDWKFALPLERKCMSKLLWSFTKTSMKEGNSRETLGNLVRMLGLYSKVKIH
jgi:glycosyltransferase involved in cell wall biosynthesis